jgi:hypothetical protein
MNTAPHSFGSRLKTERERRGIALKSIAASTKIKESLLVDLERDDLSKWPQGIFRRAFVREYAASIGLPPDLVVAEFVALFAEEQRAAPRHVAPEPAAELRLTLADGGGAPIASIATRVAGATVEMCALLGAVQVLAWATGFNFWTVCATASLAYYGLAAACWDRTPVSLWLQKDRVHAAAEDASAPARSHAVLGLLVQRTQIRRPDRQRSAISTHAVAGAENLQSASGIILPS